MMLTKEQDAQISAKMNHAMIAVSIGGVAAGYAFAQGWIVAGVLAYGLGIAFAGLEWHAKEQKR